MIAMFRPTRFDRCLRSTVSAAVMIVGAIAFAPHGAVAGDVTVNTDHGTDNVYGNSQTGNPTAIYGAASTSGNTLTIESGAVVGLAFGADDDHGSASASNNSVVVNGGSLIGVVGGYSARGTANNNQVTISGGTVTGAFIAGGASMEGSANDNTVTISGLPVFTLLGGPVLAGGYCDDSCANMFTGNRLELKTAGLNVASLYNFQYLDFYLPTTFAANATMLTVTGIADLTSGSGSSVINVGINGASSMLATGDSVTLIRAGTLRKNSNLNTTATGAGLQGVTLEYVFGISAVGNDLVATVQSMGVTEESKALSEGFISGVSLINQGADLADGKGLANAISAAETGWSSFGAISGGSIRTETGSHVDVDGVSLLAGLSGSADLSVGRLTAGVFGEYGSGSYDTFNSFASGDVRGAGNSHYVGGGLLGHQELGAIGPGHAYVEAAARAGVAHNSFSSASLSSGGVAAAYDSASPYYGASAALGYVWSLGEATSVDVSGKLIWSRLGADSVTLSTGETVAFDAVSSERVRVGARLSHALTEYITPYAGAAFEHEFDGKAYASVNGLALDAPSMTGSSGIFEAGLTLKPSDDLPLSVDLGVQAFVGQRQGVAGSLLAKLSF